MTGLKDEREYATGDFDKLILDTAEAALKKEFPHLSKKIRADIESARADIERGVRHLKHGLAFLKSDDPEVLRDAAWRMMIGAFAIGGRAVATRIVKKYLDIESRGELMKRVRKNAVEKTKERNQDIRDRVANLYLEKPGRKATDIANLIKKQNPPPGIQLLKDRTRYELVRVEVMKLKQSRR